MTTRKIDLFIYGRYNLYCNEVNNYKFYNPAEKRLDFVDYVEQNKRLLVQQYKAHRRNMRCKKS